MRGALVLQAACALGWSAAAFPSRPVLATVGDVVSFRVPHDSVALGVVHGSTGEGLRVFPLCVREGGESIDGGALLVQDEEQDWLSVPALAVLDVLEDVLFSQLPIEDRVLNPHGEHSEDVWLVSASALAIDRLLLRTRGD